MRTLTTCRAYARYLRYPLASLAAVAFFRIAN